MALFRARLQVTWGHQRGPNPTTEPHTTATERPSTPGTLPGREQTRYGPGLPIPQAPCPFRQTHRTRALAFIATVSWTSTDCIIESFSFSQKLTRLWLDGYREMVGPVLVLPPADSSKHKLGFPMRTQGGEGGEAMGSCGVCSKLGTCELEDLGTSCPDLPVMKCKETRTSEHRPWPSPGQPGSPGNALNHSKHLEHAGRGKGLVPNPSGTTWKPLPPAPSHRQVLLKTRSDCPPPPAAAKLAT